MPEFLAAASSPDVRLEHTAGLELVVPFTTPMLTRAALDAADGLAAGLNATVRLIRVQVTPWGFEPDHSPVPISFLEEQLNHMRADLPIAYEVRLARDFDYGLVSALGAHSVVVLAASSRPWRTRNERLAERLRRAGHTVMVVPESHTPELRKPIPCPM